mmetsp:Transcript_1502/g.3826  ORF Transcript_1502/g.3826 Transcript_1502/m.3826 type:complete len:487 (+) Transcript_1502:210-1670(+)
MCSRPHQRQVLWQALGGKNGASAATCFNALAGDDNIVNFEDKANTLGGEVDCRGVHQQWHHHILFKDIGHAALPYVDACRRLTGRMPVAELGDHLDGIEASVLGERIWHHLERLRELSHAVLHHSFQRVGPLGELVRQLHLGGAAAWCEVSLFDEAAEHAEGVMQRALRLVEDELVRRPAQEGDGLASVGHARDLDDLALARRDLLDELGFPELLCVEGVDIRDREAATRLADELNLVALDVFDHEDFHLGEEMERELVHRVAKDRFLDEQHVAPRLGNLLAQVKNVFALLLQDTIHLVVVRHHDVLLDVRLWRGKAELDEPDLCIFHFGRSSGGVRHTLGEDKPVDKLRVVDGAAQLLHDFDVAQVAVGGGQRVDDGEHRVHRERREELCVVRDDLGVERGGRRLDELLTVGEVEWDGHTLQDGFRLTRRNQEALRDDRWVDALLEQDIRRVEQCACNHSDRGGAIARLDILRLGQVDEHLRGRV